MHEEAVRYEQLIKRTATTEHIQRTLIDATKQFVGRQNTTSLAVEITRHVRATFERLEEEACVPLEKRTSHLIEVVEDPANPKDLILRVPSDFDAFTLTATYPERHD
jgi:hypothetical protein